MSSILIVEDDHDIAELIAHYLERAGHRVDRLTSGSEVMPRLRKQPADLVILDLMLPGMDGRLVCQALRSDPATASIPVIMLSSKDGLFDRARGRIVGSEHYLTKPFTKDELLSAIQTHVAK